MKSRLICIPAHYLIALSTLTWPKPTLDFTPFKFHAVSPIQASSSSSSSVQATRLKFIPISLHIQSISKFRQLYCQINPASDLFSPLPLQPLWLKPTLSWLHHCNSLLTQAPASAQTPTNPYSIYTVYYIQHSSRQSEVVPSLKIKAKGLTYNGLQTPVMWPLTSQL